MKGLSFTLLEISLGSEAWKTDLLLDKDIKGELRKFREKTLKLRLIVGGSK
jgi:hypothetical protein